MEYLHPPKHLLKILYKFKHFPRSLEENARGTFSVHRVDPSTPQTRRYTTLRNISCGLVFVTHAVQMLI